MTDSNQELSTMLIGSQLSDVRYVAHDTARRGGASDEPMMAVLVHSGVPLGMKLGDEEDSWTK